MTIPGRKALTLAARWLRSRLASRALILGYHRIADESWDPFSLSVRRAHFAEHLEVIRRYAVPVRLEGLARSLITGNLTHRAVAVTFDDGYSDILYRVAPLLEEHQVPATVFVVSGNLGREFWWDELARIFAPDRVPGSTQSIDVQIGGRTLALSRSCADAECVGQVLELQRSLQPLRPSVRGPLIQQIRSALGANLKKADAPVHRCVDEEELTRLAASDLVDVGAHTHSHVELGRLSEPQQESEIVECKRLLENLIDREVEAFSYPHGSTPPASRRILERLGFLSGCTSVRDVVRRGTDRLLLPRFWVSNVDGETFSRQLLTWLGSED